MPWRPGRRWPRATASAISSCIKTRRSPTPAGYPATRAVRLLRDDQVVFTCALTDQPAACAGPLLAVPAGLTHLRLDSPDPPGTLPGQPLDRYHTPALAYITRLALVSAP